MCRGDGSLTTFEWTEGTKGIRPYDRSPHVCVNWEGLMEWNRERAVDVSLPGSLVGEDGRAWP